MIGRHTPHDLPRPLLFRAKIENSSDRPLCSSMTPSKHKDFTQVAFDVVQRATGETQAPVPTKRQESGRRGGLTGGAARAATLTKERRSEIAKKAAATRWSGKLGK